MYSAYFLFPFQLFVKYAEKLQETDQRLEAIKAAMIENDDVRRPQTLLLVMFIHCVRLYCLLGTGRGAERVRGVR